MAADVIMRVFLARPGFLLARIDQICTSIHGSIARGETLSQAEFLLLLDAVGVVPQIDLARAAGVDKSTTAYVLDNLEARGWILRSPCPQDRRRSLVALAPAGGDRIEATAGNYATLQETLLAPVVPADRARLIPLLHRLAANTHGAAPPWTPACEARAGVLDGAPSFLVRRLLQIFQAQFGACTPGLNLTLRQFSLLVILSDRDAITQAGFARLFGLDPSTCGVILRSLSARGLIAREAPSRDRREHAHRISDHGRAVLAQVRPLAERSERIVLDEATEADRAWLVAVLQTIVHAHSGRLRFPGATTMPAEGHDPVP